MMIQDSFTASGERNLGSLILDVVRFTLLMEGIGAAVLFLRLLPGRPAAEALYYAVFHAVSAFCNAGFALFSDSLVFFQQDWLVNLVIGFLIICGGLGFLVVFELRRNFPFRRRTWSRLSLHTKLVLTATGALLLLGTVLILVMEWNNTLRPLPVHQKFLAAFFQSITTRTAGFNTLHIGQLANETLFVMILLMFIGASSGSCGGGVKTGTFATLVVLALSRLRGQRRPQAFRRSISDASMARAISVVLISAFVVIATTMILLMTELGAVSHPESRGKFLELLFEAVSGFGTVGLSTGITPALTLVGKLTLIVVMFTGRLGPLVIALAISRRKAVSFHYAEENIMIG
jgi:trk system potassium uptake protein TrkH